MTTIVASEEWPATLSAIGTAAAVQGVTVSADLPGIVERIVVRVRHSAVTKGDVLALLDTRQERAQLAAREAQRELARVNLERMQGLLGERRRLAGGVRSRRPRDFQQSEARVGEIRADDRAQDDPRAVLRRARHPRRSISVSTSPAAATARRAAVARARST